MADRGRFLDIARRAAPFVAVLVCAIIVEVRAASHTADRSADTDSNAVSTSHRIDSVLLDEELRSIAIVAPDDRRPPLTPGDRVDVYGTDILTGDVEVIALDVVVLSTTPTHIVVAAPIETVEAVARRGDYATFTVVGRSN